MHTNYIWFILFFVACITIGIIWEIFRTRCPACKKFHARKIMRNDRHTDFDYSGHDKHTHVRSTTYCKCKFCGHEWVQHYTSTKRNN